MKVLWFSNTPSLARKIIFNEESNATGNWIESLETKLREEDSLRLGIVFYGKVDRKLKSLKNGNVEYFIIPNKFNTPFKKFISNIFGQIEYENDIKIYKEIINNFKPDLIHIWGLESPYISILHKKNTIPIIVHLQGILAPYSYKYYPTFSKGEINRALGFKEKLKGVSYFSDKLRFNKKLLREFKSLSCIEYYFGRTDWDRRCVKILSPSARYYHCDEIMRKDFYDFIWKKTRENILRFFTTISESPFKGIDTIFQVADLIRKKYPNLEFTWDIAGLNKDSLSVRVMKARGYDTFNNFNYLGNLNSKVLIENMLKADVFIYLSRIENGCNAVQEAMLLGLPIISTYAGGISTTLIDKETGILVQEGEPVSISGAIIELIENHDLAITLGKNARHLAIVRHDPNKIAETVIKTYAELISLSKSIIIQAD